MKHPYLIEIHDKRHIEHFGKKGQGLHWLAEHRLPIPKTWVLTFEAARRIAAEGFFPEIDDLLKSHIDEITCYAVRSSANLEDAKEFSFAGQFTTRTNVQGYQDLQQAIRDVLDSADAKTLEPYLKQTGEDPAKLQMAVLIQEMVKPVLAGVVFSKNPITGLDEVVIESVHGSGEALVQEGVTPQRWIYRWGQFTTKSERDEKYTDVIRNIAQETRKIAKLFGSPVDLEWAFDGEKLYWLQIRPITTRINVPLYSNRISREVLPGMIKPLIASINIPLVNTAWIRLFDSLMGPTHLKPEDLTRLFHYRAYFNMAAIGTIFEILGFPRESLELLLGFERTAGRPTFRPSARTLQHLPRLIRFILSAWNYDRTVRAQLDTYAEQAREIQSEDIRSLSARALLVRIDLLYQFNIKIAYQNIVIPLLMSMYAALLKSRLKRFGVDFVHFDLTDGFDDIKPYDPNVVLDELKNDFECLPPSVKDKISQAKYVELEKIEGAQAFKAAVDQFIQKFGHLSESGNDFSRIPWREDRGMVLAMILNHHAAERDNQKVTWGTLRASAFRKFLIHPIFYRARRFRLLREQVSSLYTCSYGWFRMYFLALARQFMQQGVLNEENDIFYLTIQEIGTLVAQPAAQFQELIRSRRDEMDQCRDAVLPEIIYGNAAPPLSLLKGSIDKLTGTPTSSGYFQGPLKVVRSTEDFDKVQRGDVIAIPYSDVAWTPLFARAGAVVAESGGILSHSSIVAREYGIPCVVSVTGACNLPEGSEVVVDGFQGTINIVREK